MIFFGAFTVISIAFLGHSQILGDTIEQDAVDLTSLAATCSSETTYKLFTAALIIRLVSVHDPDAVFRVWPSETVSEIYFYEKSRLLKEKGIPNAEELASISKSAVLLLDDFTISRFYFVAVNAVGRFLVGEGVVNCDNAIQTATELFRNEQLVFKSLDPSELGSYIGALISGLQKLLEDVGLTADANKDNWGKLSHYFYSEYSKFASWYKQNA